MKFKVLATIILVFSAFNIYLLAASTIALERKLTKLEQRVGIKQPIDKARLWTLIQDWRLRQGKMPYQEDKNLCEFANIRVGEIKTDWSHDGYTKGKSYFYSEHPEYSGTGENLARGYYSESDVLDAWLKSASHAANLKYDFKYSCLAVDDTYAVHIFGNKE